MKLYKYLLGLSALLLMLLAAPLSFADDMAPAGEMAAPAAEAPAAPAEEAPKLDSGDTARLQSSQSEWLPDWPGRSLFFLPAEH